MPPHIPREREAYFFTLVRSLPDLCSNVTILRAEDTSTREPQRPSYPWVEFVGPVKLTVYLPIGSGPLALDGWATGNL